MKHFVIKYTFYSNGRHNTHCVIKKCIFYNVYRKITHGCYIAITVIYVNTHTYTPTFILVYKV